jgi:hypothetical protein
MHSAIRFDIFLITSISSVCITSLAVSGSLYFTSLAIGNCILEDDFSETLEIECS